MSPTGNGLSDHDLVIVGGGPAGLSAALFAVAEVPALVDRLVVLEKERYPREKICAGAIGGRADRLLETIGVRVDVPGAPIRGLSVCSAAGDLQHRLGDGSVIGRVVRRMEFDHALAEVARRRGIRIVEAARVTSVEAEPRQVRIESTAGALRARALVGADGVGSCVRRALGFGRGLLHAQVVEVDSPAARGDLPSDLLHFDIGDPTLAGYAWDFPTVVDGERLVSRGVYDLRWETRPSAGAERSDAEAAPAGDRVDVAVRLRARLERLGIAAAPLRMKRFSERGLSLREPLSRPRVLLIGEAAGIDPVLGEGIAQAIQYGAVAGRYLARALSRDELGFETWRRELYRTRLGWDLRVRSAAVRAFYGRTRPAMERWVTGSSALATAGMRYFAGERVPRERIARAAADLARAAWAALAATASPGAPRRAPWS